MTEARGSVARVVRAAAASGLDIAVTMMPDSTRTAAEAAAACNCAPGQIVKSLVFADGADGLVLLLVAGDREVVPERAGKAAGCELRRADAEKVREVTGFAIGGVSPLGHLNPLPVFMDPALLDHDTVWAAAGAPNAVFPVSPAQLQDAVAARLLPEEATRPLVR